MKIRRNVSLIIVVMSLIAACSNDLPPQVNNKNRVPINVEPVHKIRLSNGGMLSNLACEAVLCLSKPGDQKPIQCKESLDYFDSLKPSNQRKFLNSCKYISTEAMKRTNLMQLAKK